MGDSHRVDKVSIYHVLKTQYEPREKPGRTPTRKDVTPFPRSSNPLDLFFWRTL